MKLERLTLKGFSSAFPGVVDLKLRDLPAGLVAIVGPNGKGKTTLLEVPPGAIFRQLPSRNGADPVDYATGRDSGIGLEYSVDAGTFSSKLSLDGPKRNTDALLEQLVDGRWVPLNDGKRSTYDVAIAERFPSFDLFINSSFAAQGRGDEFTRRKPSQRKDLFVEFLALQHYAAMAKTCVEAAELVADARLRLEVQVEQLQLQTAPGIATQLDALAHQLQTSGGGAELRQRELREELAQLELRASTLADQVGAYTAAQVRVRGLEADLTAKRTELAGVQAQRSKAVAGLEADRARIAAKRDADVAEADKRIAGNEQILGMADAIAAAGATLTRLDEEFGAARSAFTERQAEYRQAVEQLRQVEKQLGALATVEDRRDRAQRDTGILDTVPCGGAGAYAACQFLTDATAAQAQLQALNAQLEPKAALADAVGRQVVDVERLGAAVKALQETTSALETQRVEPAKLVKYATPLAEAKAKIAGYEEAKAKATADAAEQLDAVDVQHHQRMGDLDEVAATLGVEIARLELALTLGKVDLDEAAAGNTKAVVLQADLAAARAEWDRVTAAIATTASGRDELERRRQEFATKREQLAAVRGRLAQVDQELVEWRDLRKALDKGGLPDLEIDAAGPTITATTNALLTSCYSTRFTVELVTQVEKADKSGMRDEFTVKVFDNETGGDWRDIAQLSGGEKVVVQEALMCAIAVYVNERSPMPIRTLWRDETGAALDPANAIAYVHMLRKVLELGHFHHVFFISHNPAAAALADTQIRVGGGTAVLVYPPFLEVA